MTEALSVETTAAPARGRLRDAVLRGAILAAGLALVGVGIRMLAPGLLSGGLAANVRAHGFAGIAEFLAIGTLACAVGLPRQAVCFAAGLAFGAAAGTALALAATLAASLVDFAWARVVARDWARRRLLGRYRRLAELDRFLGANPFTAILTLRLLPVGNALMLSLLAGLSRVGVGAFTAASAIGALPQTLVFALLGSGIGLGHVARLVLAACLFVASALLGAVLMRRSAVAATVSG